MVKVFGFGGELPLQGSYEGYCKGSWWGINIGALLISIGVLSKGSYKEFDTAFYKGLTEEP